MAKKKQRAGQAWRTKESRELAKAVEKAGGTVERSGQGHMKVTGPRGVAFVASDPGSNRLEQTYKTIRDKTGLMI